MLMLIFNQSCYNSVDVCTEFHGNPSNKCDPRGKVKGSSKSLRFIVSEPGMSPPVVPIFWVDVEIFYRVSVKHDTCTWPKDERRPVDAIDLVLRRPRADGFQPLKSNLRKKNRPIEIQSLACFLPSLAVSLSRRQAKETLKTLTF